MLNVIQYTLKLVCSASYYIKKVYSFTSHCIFISRLVISIYYLKPEFNIVIFIHYKPRIAAKLDINAWELTRLNTLT